MGGTDRPLFQTLRKSYNTANMKKELSDIEKHSAGAIVRHSSPFDNLESYSNNQEITKSFIDEWVIPFYFNLNKIDVEWIHFMSTTLPKITSEVILTNLGEFNWRTRQTGAYFAAITNKTECIEIIGTHLLKSEVCYAGFEYVKALAFFNVPESIEYFTKYLNQYLKRPDLHFDQIGVLIALNNLDKINGTNIVDQYRGDWMKFKKDQEIGAVQQMKSLVDLGYIEKSALDKIPVSNSSFDETIDSSAFEKQINAISVIKESN